MSEISVRLTGDNAEYRSMVDDSLARAQQLDANLKKLNISILSEKSAKDSARAMEAIMAAQEKLASRTRQIAIDEASGAQKIKMLQEDLVSLAQQRQSLEQGTAERAKADLAFEEKKLQLRTSIANETGREASEAAKIPPEIDKSNEKMSTLEKGWKSLTKGFAAPQLGTTLATALGINLQSMAERVARFISGVTKEEEEALKQLEQISTEVADSNIRNMQALLTEEQKYRHDLSERDKLLDRIATRQIRSTADLVEQKRDELLLNQRIAAIQEYQTRLLAIMREKDAADTRLRIEKSREAFEAEISILKAVERIRVIKEQILIKEDAIVAGAFKGVALEEQRKTVEELRVRLRREELDIIKQKEARAKEEFEINKELGAMLLKGLENLNEEEKLRLQLLTGQTTQAKIQAELADLTTKAKAGTLTAAERARLAVLTGQTGQLKTQVSAMDELNTKVKEFTSLLGRSGQDYESQSTSSLSGALARARAELQRLGNDTSYSSAFAPGQKNPFFYTLQTEVAAMERELSLRRAVGGYADRYGEDAARFKFGDTVTDRALREMQDASTRSATAIEDIRDRLVGSGKFPRR